MLLPVGRKVWAIATIFLIMSSAAHIYAGDDLESVGHSLLSRARRLFECTVHCQIVRNADYTVVGTVCRSTTRRGDTGTICSDLRSAINRDVPRGHYKRHCRCQCRQR